MREVDNSNDSDFERVDVEQIIASKNPKLLKRLPRFVIRYLKRIIHQDEVNFILKTYKNDYGLDFVNSLLKHLSVTYTDYGLDKLPNDGKYLFVSNHPLGGFDGVILMSAIGKKYPNIKFVVNDLLMYLRQLRPLFLPVNHHGRQSSDYYKSLQDAYDSDDQILYFPAGLCSRKIKRVITDLPWKKSIIKIAKDHKRDIVPIFFDGRNSNFFYNLSNFRTTLGIKANLEMLYLSDELFRQRNMHFNLYMGEPISYQFLESGSVTEMLSFVRSSVYALNPNTKK